MTVNLDRFDYALCLWRTSFRHPVNLVVFSLLAVFLALSQMRSHPGGGAVAMTITIVAAFLTVFLCMLFGIFLTTLGMVILVRKERGVLGESTYRITEAGLAISSSTREGLIKWGGVHSLVRTRRHVYIRLTHSACLDIPRRFFADTASDDEFWNSLQPLVAKKNS